MVTEQQLTGVMLKHFAHALCVTMHTEQKNLFMHISLKHACHENKIHFEFMWMLESYTVQVRAGGAVSV